MMPDIRKIKEDAYERGLISGIGLGLGLTILFMIVFNSI